MEREIGMLQQKFKITSDTLSINIIDSGDDPIIDKILLVLF